MIKLKDLYPNQASFMKEETISEGPDSELFKKLSKHQAEIFKLLNNYKSKANVPAIARSFMIGLKNQLKKDKMVESINENIKIKNNTLEDIDQYDFNDGPSAQQTG